MGHSHIENELEPLPMAEAPRGIDSLVEENRRRREEEVRAAIEARFREPYLTRMMEPSYREASLVPTEPEGPADYVRAGAMRLVDALGGGDQGQRRLGDFAANVMNLTPFQAAYDAGKAGQKGEYGMAALYGAGAALPTAMNAYGLAKTMPRAAGIEALPFDPSRRALVTLGESARKADDVSVVPVTGIENLLSRPVNRREFNEAAAKTAAGATALASGVKAASKVAPAVAKKFGIGEAAEYAARLFDEPVANPRVLEAFAGKEPPRLIDVLDNDSWQSYSLSKNKGLDLEGLRKTEVSTIRSKIEAKLGRPLTDQEKVDLIEFPIIKKNVLQSLDADSGFGMVPNRQGLSVISADMELFEPGTSNVLKATTGKTPKTISEAEALINDARLFNGERFSRASFFDRFGKDPGVSDEAFKRMLNEPFPADTGRTIGQVYQDSVDEYRAILNEKLQNFKAANQAKAERNPKINPDKFTPSQKKEFNNGYDYAYDD